MVHLTPLRVAGWGVYRPRHSRASTEIDARFGKPDGWCEGEFGIRSRAVAGPDETTSRMGADAGRAALARAGWADGEFDVLVGACGVMEQPIPSTSVLIQRELGLGSSGIHCFDVNQTCLSFVTAMDLVAMGFASGRWRRALIVSSDIASAGLDAADPKSTSIFGDGAAAVAVEAMDDPHGPAMLARAFRTFGTGSHLATLASGGTRLRVEQGYEALVEGSRFRMDAFGIFKAAARSLPGVIEKALGDAGLVRDDLDLVVCHQASAPGVEHVRRLFAPRSERVVDIFADTGNQIATSIPTVLAYALERKLVGPGSKVLILGTAAGVSAAAVLLRI